MRDVSVRQATDEDRRVWDAHAHHPLQSWAWGQFRQSLGQRVIRLVTEAGGTVSDVWQMTMHRIPLPGGYTVAYFPKGPMPTQDMLDKLMHWGADNACIYIQMEPDVPVDEKALLPPEKRLVPSHHPLFTNHTFVLDLTTAEDVLLSAMHQKTRYNIRVAAKKGVVIKQDDSQHAFEAYLRLMQETTDRQAYYAHDVAYHATMWDVMHESGIAHMWTATYEDTILAAWIVFVWKDTVYYPYGASSRLHRNVMAPNLLLWEIARWGKQKGYKRFDLWGAMGPDPDPADPWYGFHKFKSGYNPKLVEYIGSYDLIVNKPLYYGFVTANKLRWAALRLMKK